MQAPGWGSGRGTLTSALESSGGQSGKEAHSPWVPPQPLPPGHTPVSRVHVAALPQVLPEASWPSFAGDGPCDPDELFSVRLLM